MDLGDIDRSAAWRQPGQLNHPSVHKPLIILELFKYAQFMPL